jgi:hypothetical protein
MVLFAASASCDSGGSGRVNRYCEAFCTWQDNCTDWFDDEWDSQGECVGDCKEDLADSWDSGECRSEWLSYYTCYYEAIADDCNGAEGWDCGDQWERLEDCWEENDQYNGDEF